MKSKMIEKLVVNLPGYNCGACGQTDCCSFARSLMEGKTMITKCPVLLQEPFKLRRKKIEELLMIGEVYKNSEIVGLIDKVEADFILEPLNGEISCRETLACFAPYRIGKGELVRYRPLGCPITHFARVILNYKGLIDVWIEGPERITGKEELYIELGICLVLSFQGQIEGPLPNIGQTVKFLPKHCMMGKVHSGIVVQLEDNKSRIDSIDLKVWQHAPQHMEVSHPSK